MNGTYVIFIESVLYLYHVYSCIMYTYIIYTLVPLLYFIFFFLYKGGEGNGVDTCTGHVDTYTHMHDIYGPYVQ